MRSNRRILPHFQTQIYNCEIGCERMDLVIGRTFHFRSHPFSIAMVLLVFIPIAPYTPVSRRLVTMGSIANCLKQPQHNTSISLVTI